MVYVVFFILILFTYLTFDLIINPEKYTKLAGFVVGKKENEKNK